MYYTGVFRARRSEARIQRMLWKVNYSDIVFLNAVCMSAYTFVAGMFTRCRVSRPKSNSNLPKTPRNSLENRDDTSDSEILSVIRPTTNNTIPTLSFFTGWTPFPSLNQQHHSTEDTTFSHETDETLSINQSINQLINQPTNQFNSNFAAQEPDSKRYAAEIIDKNSKRNKQCAYMYICAGRDVKSGLGVKLL